MTTSDLLNRSLRRLGFFGLLLIVFLSGSLSLRAQAVNNETEAIETIDHQLSDLVESEDFSGAVLIARGDEVLFRKGYGFAVIEWEVPNTPDTVFRIGSITKQFTAMAILRLQEDGLLDIDDFICDYLEDCPDTWSEITIYHLLTHTSGIVSYTDSDTTRRQLMFSDAPSNAVIATFINLPLQFEPGSDWSYSNSGYHLLGDIVAEVAGKGYGRYLRETFFVPLGMESTDIESNTRVIARRAEGYVNRTTRADYINMNVPYSAGALVSTVEDLFLWQRALYTGQIVREKTLDEMRERAVAVDDRNKYGYGLIYEIRDGQEVIWHGGGINGFVTQTSYLPEYDLTLIVLTNRENPAVESATTVIFEAMVAVADTSSP